MTSKINVNTKNLDDIITVSNQTLVSDIANVNNNTLVVYKKDGSVKVNELKGDIPNVVTGGDVGQTENISITISQGSGNLSFTVPYFTVDENGRVMSSVDKTVSISNPSYTNYMNYHNYSQYNNYHNYSDYASYSNYYNYGNYGNYGNYTSYTQYSNYTQYSSYSNYSDYNDRD